jgi:hypothetical protein
MSHASSRKPPSTGAQIAMELQRNRELTNKLYTARGEVPPDDAACATASIRPPCCGSRAVLRPCDPLRRSDHSMSEIPPSNVRRPWEVYAKMPGVSCRHSNQRAVSAARRRPTAAPLAQVDSLYSGLSKRTPCGAFFTS